MTAQMIVSPSGDELVIITRDEYEELLDARDHAAAMRDVNVGAMPTLTEAELQDYLAEAIPLAFWRKRAGMTQTALAEAAAISQPYLSQIEAGTRTGDVATTARLARALGVRIEDLLPVSA